MVTINYIKLTERFTDFFLLPMMLERHKFNIPKDYIKYVDCGCYIITAVCNVHILMVLKCYIH